MSIAEIAAALAAVPDDDLRSLHASLAGELAVAPDLIGWLEAAADWEMERRAGHRGEFPDPHWSGDEGEVDCGLVALAILHASFDGDACVDKLLDVAAELLCTPPEGSSRLVS